MSERHKLPGYIIGLNIAMAVIFLAICALIFALSMSAKELGWGLPTADSQSAAASQITEEAPSDTVE